MHFVSREWLVLGILMAVTVLGGGTAACVSSDSPHPPPPTSIPPTTIPTTSIPDTTIPDTTVPRPRPGLCPTAYNDRYQVAAGGTLQVDVPGGVAANDVYPCGGPIRVILVSGPSHGTLTGDLYSGFEYTPDAGFVGEDGFTYEIQYIVTGSGIVDTDTATATISVR